MRTKLVVGMIAIMLASAADAKKKKELPPPPPPPPVPVVVIPPRPTPPLWASKTLTVPALGPDGVRRTVNYGITPAQTTWNLRAAYNVAALNCLRPEHGEILVGYKKFLKANAKSLALANRTVDGEFRARFGAKFIKPREAYMTQVYNFYALPPTVPQFCDAALAMSRTSLTVTPKTLTGFAATELPVLDSVFGQFFSAYDQWKTDAALWDARYAPTPAVTLPPAFVTPAPGAAPVPAPGTVVQPPVATSTTAAVATAAAASTTASTMGPKLPGT